MSTLPALPQSHARTARKLVGMFVGIGAVAFGITCLFLSMRAVMDIGGSCASGGPFEVSRPCPGGVGWLTPVSLLIALIGAGIYVASVIDGGPDVSLLLWSALFVPLGWNFLEYGFTSVEGSGIVWSWVVCGLLFWAMGLPPLLLLLKREHLLRVFWGGPPQPVKGTKAKAKALVPTLPPQFRRRRAQPSPAPAPPRPAPRMPDDGGGDLVARLERLAELRASGALDEDEYERAKARVLEDEG
jgi:hypothetical protein